MPLLRKFLRLVATVLVVPVLLFEEWGWEPLAALLSRLARMPIWAWLERAIGRLPPWAALLVFFLPAIALFPIKLAALYLFGNGHLASGTMLLIGAKVGGTAIVARLFQLTHPALMEIPLFARWYPRWKYWKDQLLTVAGRAGRQGNGAPLVAKRGAQRLTAGHSRQFLFHPD